MGHMGQEVRLCLCRLIMTVSVDTVLDDNADLPEKLSVLLIFLIMNGLLKHDSSDAMSPAVFSGPLFLL